MELLGIGVALQMGVDAVVGLRLLALAARTRKLPELGFGLTFVLLGGVGFPLSVVARGELAPSPEAAGTLLVAGFAAQNAGCLALFAVTWRVFRPESRLAAAAVALAAAAFVASLVGHGATVGFHGGVDESPWYYVGFAARGLAFAWAAFESGRYVRLLGRREALGLGNPVVRDRFRLWCLASCTIVATFLVVLAGRLTTGNPVESPWVLGTTSVGGLVVAIALWLAFLPPRAYRERVAARAAAR